MKLKRFADSGAASEVQTKRRFFDPTLDSKNTRRDRRKTGAFNFVQEGSMIKRGEILRKKMAMAELERREREGGDTQMIDEEVKVESKENQKEESEPRKEGEE